MKIRPVFTFAVILIVMALTGCVEAPATLPPIELPPEPRMLPEDQITPIPPSPTTVAYVYQSTNMPPATHTPLPSLAEIMTRAAPPDDVNPLTGLRVDNLKLLDRRPILVKVTNYPRSVRPQWGLSQADQVYEYYLEDEMTRFIGVFYSRDAERIGPVRSGRFFDEHIIRMYKGIFVFGYADDPVIDAFTNSDYSGRLVVEQPDNCPPLCRIGSKNDYNTLFLNSAKLGAYLAERGTHNSRPNLDGFRFGKDSNTGSPAVQIVMRYSAVSYNRWDYDGQSKRYLRFQDAKDAKPGEEDYQPLTDAANDAQLSADNVVVLLMPHDYYRRSSSTEIFKMNFFGEGAAYAFHNGLMTPLKWQRNGADTIFSLAYQDGAPFALNPGVTWFEVLGQSSTLEQKPEQVWRFNFNLP